ncbi:MAG: hypothetical protein QNJ60_21285 [Xenococcaceae cyanobacterium MO_188.B19]|nr:hypothetical protein [Xenococcaceae cyanobacterium MO_188.B19]
MSSSVQVIENDVGLYFLITQSVEWYLVANFKENIPYGENKEIRKGTKHFAPM